MKPITLNQLIAWAKQGIGLAVLVLLAAALLNYFGVRVPVIKVLTPDQLVRVCGAWWLASKAV